MVFSLQNFLLASLPEEITIAFFAYALLSKRNIKVIRVVLAGIISAVLFEFIRAVFYPDSTITALIQLCAFILILFFFYEINFLESLIISLLTTLILTALMGAIVNIDLLLLGKDFSDYNNDILVRLIATMPCLVIMAILSLVLHRTKFIKLNLKNKNVKAFDLSKLHFIVFQLASTLILILINYKIFLNYLKVFNTGYDKFLIISSIIVSSLISLLSILSVYKIIKNIKKDEKERELAMNRELVQNVSYMYNLLKEKKYLELEEILVNLNTDVIEKV